MSPDFGRLSLALSAENPREGGAQGSVVLVEIAVMARRRFAVRPLRLCVWRYDPVGLAVGEQTRDRPVGANELLHAEERFAIWPNAGDAETILECVETR